VCRTMQLPANGVGKILHFLSQNWRISNKFVAKTLQTNLFHIRLSELQLCLWAMPMDPIFCATARPIIYNWTTKPVELPHSLQIPFPMGYNFYAFSWSNIYKRARLWTHRTRFDNAVPVVLLENNVKTAEIVKIESWSFSSAEIRRNTTF
jgi:hypothetical protein